MTIEEGGRYRLGTITFSGNKQITNAKALRSNLPNQGWRLVQRHGCEQGTGQPEEGLWGPGLHQLWGDSPRLRTTSRRKLFRWISDIDEGKQFFVSRIEFTGNTTTRDKVIRRELMLDEGSVYNSQLWEYSLLRLNQLQYFDPLKVDQGLRSTSGSR